MVETWPVVEPFGVREGDEFDEVLVAVEGFGEENESSTGLVNHGLFIKASARREEGIETNDGLDAFFGAGFIKIDGTVEGASIGNSEGVLPVFFGGFGEFFGGGEGVEEGIVGVDVEVNKLRRQRRGFRHGVSIPKIRGTVIYTMQEWLVGVDEAGRGPLAGPVAVGVVLIPAQFDWALLPGVGDSKKIAEKKREHVYEQSLQLAAAGLLWSTVELGAAADIDRQGIAVVIRTLIQRGLDTVRANAADGRRLSQAWTVGDYRPATPLDWSHVRVKLDGSLRAPAYCVHQETIIKGDATEMVIGLASILAKVTRDAYMRQAATQPAYRPYEFARHKGYGTARHRRLIAEYGLSPEHRRSYCKNIKML